MLRTLSSFVFPLAIAAVLSPPVVGRAAAQAPPAHVHYDTPAGFDAPAAPGKPLAPRLQNLGVHTFPVSTKVERAQLFMNQGLNLAYGFNHAEAARAFAEAARLDSGLAMAYWGQALVLGPNINAAMNGDDEPKAAALIQKAVSMMGTATPRERAYIDALAARYTGKPADRAQADRAYAAAMQRVAQSFPADLDARTLYAEAPMDLRPWSAGPRRQAVSHTIVQASSRRVLAAHKNHPVRCICGSPGRRPTPERAEAEVIAAADAGRRSSCTCRPYLSACRAACGRDQVEHPRGESR